MTKLRGVYKLVTNTIKLVVHNWHHDVCNQINSNRSVRFRLVGDVLQANIRTVEHRKMLVFIVTVWVSGSLHIKGK